MLLTPDVGAEPTLEVGAVLVPDVEAVPDGLADPAADDVPAVVLGPVVEVVPDVEGLPVEDVDELSDEEVDELLDEEVVPVSALPGAATARAVPPIAARPNVTRAAVLAIRVLII